MSERFLDEEVISQVKEVFQNLDKPVEIVLFTSAKNSQSCDDTQQLMSEITEISSKLSLSVHDVDAEPELARKYNIENTPGVVLAAKDGENITDYGVRYAGMPQGHEFGTIVNELVRVSKRDSELGAEARAFLGELKKPIKFMVFFTPT